MRAARLVPVLMLLGAPAPALGALDAGADRPYELQVVLHVADNRFLTPLFQDEVRRAVGDQLRLGFGALANVEVVRTHPLLRDVETRGLQAALDGWDEVSDRQTHFVLLDYAAGQYRLQTRLHDGATAQAGALVRRAETADRAMVPLLAARLVEQSFAPSGTVTGAGNEVNLALRGGALGVAMARWVKPGEVFAVSRVTQDGGRQRGARVAWALLEVLEAPKAGVCRCKYWHRFKEDALGEAPGTLGFRATKLPTGTGPVRVRLVDEDRFEPHRGVPVQVVQPATKKQAELATDGGGLAVTREPFAHFALVRVLSGGVVRAQMPVEIIPGRTAVCRLKLQEDSDTLAAAVRRRDAWVRRVLESSLLASERSAELNRLLNQSFEAALETGRAGLKSMEAELAQLSRERDELQSLAREHKLPAARLDTRQGDQELAKLRERHKDLAQFVQRVGGILKEGGGAEALGLQKLIEQARLSESEAEFGRALRLYEQVLQASPDQAKVRERAEKLKEEWAVRGPKHAQAREFIYQVWPKLDVAGLRKNLDAAKEALAACKEAGDRLTPLRMARANAVHAANLTRHLETLGRQDSEDSRNQAKAALELSDRLRELHALAGQD